jgi:hypothetical protein
LIPSFLSLLINHPSYASMLYGLRKDEFKKQS